MIDYNATLQEFFKEVLVFLEKRKLVARDEIESERIKNAIRAVNKVAENPKQYAEYNARVCDGLELWAEPFMTNPRDNSVYLIYNRVLNAMGNLWSQYDCYRQEAQEILLQSRQQMKCKNAGNVFKSMYLSMLSLKKFGVEKQR